MQQPSFWPIAVSSAFYGRFDETFLAECRENEIHAVELSSPWHELTGALDFEERPEACAALAARYGVKFTSIHLPFHGEGVQIDLASPDETVRGESVELQIRLLHSAAKCAIPIAVVHPCLEPVPEEERALRLGQAAKSLRALVRAAKPLGIRVAAENLPRSCLCRTPVEMNALLDAAPGLYVCFDTNHSLLQSNEAYIRAVGRRIITLHVSDYDFVDERHLLPFEGKIDWAALLDELRQADYRGLFTFEADSHRIHTLRELRDCYDRLAGMQKRG